MCSGPAGAMLVLTVHLLGYREAVLSLMLNVCISKMFSCAHHHRALQRGIYRNELYMFMYGFVDMHV